MIKCCGIDMLRAHDWYHCTVCGKRLREHPHGKEPEMIAEMVIEEVHDDTMTWKEFHEIFHELWRAGHYEDYEPKVPEEWKQ